MRVYTRLNGKLACWQVEDLDADTAVKLVRDELGLKHKATILVLVKY